MLFTLLRTVDYLVVVSRMLNPNRKKKKKESPKHHMVVPKKKHCPSYILMCCLCLLYLDYTCIYFYILISNLLHWYMLSVLCIFFFLFEGKLCMFAVGSSLSSKVCGYKLHYKQNYSVPRYDALVFRKEKVRPSTRDILYWEWILEEEKNCLTQPWFVHGVWCKSQVAPLLEAPQNQSVRKMSVLSDQVI